ncbi:MAG: hypothetical protein ACI9VN_003063, partial [Patescibacteria group bacterium]
AFEVGIFVNIARLIYLQPADLQLFKLPSPLLF